MVEGGGAEGAVEEGGGAGEAELVFFCNGWYTTKSMKLSCKQPYVCMYVCMHTATGVS